MTTHISTFPLMRSVLLIIHREIVALDQPASAADQDGVYKPSLPKTPLGLTSIDQPLSIHLFI